MLKNPLVKAALAVFVFLFIRIAWATDFSSTNFTVRDPVNSGGGGYSSSNNFQLWSSISQPAIGKSTSDSKELRSGFLYFSAATPTPTPTATPTPTSDPGGGNIPPPSGGAGGPPAIGLPPLVPPLGPFIPPFVTFITGEEIPATCAGASRSDLNCDGNVDLRDLSILFSKPFFATGRALSLLFSDWTSRLPIPQIQPDTSQIAEASPLATPPAGLAEIGSVVSTATPSGAEEYLTPSFWSRIIGFIGKIFLGVLKFLARLMGF
mgnify:CR=1 FL=1